MRFQKCKDLMSQLLARSPLRSWPVRVKMGLAKGARWTAFPCSSYWRGNTETDVEAAIRAHGSMKGGCCWDLGAHFGIYTVGMGLAVGPTGQIAAFEPDPLSFDKCRRHVEMNRMSWCKLFNAGVSNLPGRSHFIVRAGLGATTSHLRYEDENECLSSQTIEIPLVQLDQLVENGEIRQPDFIKVDVEGHGARALAGACRSISAARPTLVMSFHSKKELDGTQALLEPIGYFAQGMDGCVITWEDCLYRTAVLRPR